MDNISTEIANSIKDRITGPLGFIATTFALYNWKWIYFLMFSKKTAELKISIVEMHLTTSRFIYPIIIGIALSIAMPFIRLLMTYITAIAVSSEDKKKYLMKTSLDNHISQQNKTIVERNLDIQQKESKIDDLLKEQSTLSDEVRKLNISKDELMGQESSLKQKISEAEIRNHRLE
ncbi:hypothetical protein NMF47_13140, partial [Serratia nevei]|uniref:hypothetical protein n=1 Tax=Serratia nevei TaxID=2703794 RepID=UPI0027E51994